MNPKRVPNKKGVTLVELLVGLVISAVIVAGVYRVFITQTRTYTVQEQVVEVQQNIRGAMELMLRDIRMAGYKSNISPVTLTTSIFPGDVMTLRNDAIRMEYQRGGNVNRVVYFIDNTDPLNLKLMRHLYINGALSVGEAVLENVNTLNFTYGVDGTVGIETSQNGAVDDQNGDGVIDVNDLQVTAGTVNGGNLNIVAVRVNLSAEPSNPNANPDINNIVPRSLVSTVNLRNLCLVKSN